MGKYGFYWAAFPDYTGKKASAKKSPPNIGGLFSAWGLLFCEIGKQPKKTHISPFKTMEAGRNL